MAEQEKVQDVNYGVLLPVSLEKFYIEKAEAGKEEKRYVEGLAAAPGRDRNVPVYELTEECLKEAAKDLRVNSVLFLEHDRTQPIGKIVEVKYLPGKGLWIKCMVSQTATKVWQMITEGILTGFSIGGRVKKFIEILPKKAAGAAESAQTVFDQLKQIVRRVLRIELMEVSVVALPANVNTRIWQHYVAKSFDLKIDASGGGEIKMSEKDFNPAEEAAEEAEIGKELETPPAAPAAPEAPAAPAAPEAPAAAPAAPAAEKPAEQPAAPAEAPAAPAEAPAAPVEKAVEPPPAAPVAPVVPETPAPAAPAPEAPAAPVAPPAVVKAVEPVAPAAPAAPAEAPAAPAAPAPETPEDIEKQWGDLTAMVKKLRAIAAMKDAAKMSDALEKLCSDAEGKGKKKVKKDLAEDALELISNLQKTIDELKLSVVSKDTLKEAVKEVIGNIPDEIRKSILKVDPEKKAEEDTEKGLSTEEKMDKALKKIYQG